MKSALVLAAFCFVAECIEWLINDLHWYFSDSERIWAIRRVLRPVSRLGLPIVGIMLSIAFLSQRDKR